MSLTFRRLVAAACVAAALIATPMSTMAQTPPAASRSTGRTFEMRTYFCHPGRLDALNKRFRDHTTKLFTKHGMENVGYWMPVDKPDVLVYILAHKSKEAADASWKAFRDDPAWQKARAESEVDGPIIVKIETTWLSPTDYSAIK